MSESSNLIVNSHGFSLLGYEPTMVNPSILLALRLLSPINSINAMIHIGLNYVLVCSHFVCGGILDIVPILMGPGNSKPVKLVGSQQNASKT